MITKAVRHWRIGKIIEGKVEFFEMNEFEESGVGMKFTLKATAAKVYANYVT